MGQRRGRGYMTKGRGRTSLYKNNQREARNSNARTRIENNAMVQSRRDNTFFFNEIRLIMIFSHFSQLLHSLAHTHIRANAHTAFFLTPFLSLFLSFLTFHSFYSLSLTLSLFLFFFLVPDSQPLSHSVFHARIVRQWLQ